MTHPKFHFSKKYKLLREKAEALSKESDYQSPYHLENDLEKLIEELDISYMELELQNQVLLETQTDLEHSRNYFNDLFHHSPIGYIILDTHGVIQQMNMNAAKILGWETDQLVGLRLHMFIPVNCFVTYDKCLQSLMKLKKPQSCKIQVKINLHNSKWVRMDFWLHKKNENHEQQILCAMMDISHEKQAEISLKESNNHLEQLVLERTRDLVDARERAVQLSKTKDEFLANMSHEIRTPMNGIVGMAQMLQKTEMNPQQREYVQTIIGSSGALMTIINDILDLSKVEAGKLVLMPEHFDIRMVIDNVVKVLSTRIYEKQLEFAAIFSAKVPPYLYGDSVRLSQILMNLLSNAVKFTKSGEITIHTELMEKNDKHAIIRFKISDTGIGISDSQKHLLFEPFSQINSPMVKKSVGTGLGLTISKKIAQMMDGDIGFESIYTKGTTFWATIKMELSPIDQVNEKKYPQYRILIIDPYHHRRAALREYFNMLGMTFDETTSAISGQNQLIESENKKIPYDFCFVDPDLSIDKNLLFWQWVEKYKTEISARMIAIVSPMAPEILFCETFADQITKPVTWTGLCRIFDQLNQKKSKADMKADTENQHTLNKEKYIMVVDDDPTNQNVMQSILKQENFQVFSAIDGKEAIELLATNHCDLIFMDMLMPNLNGIDTTKVIRDQSSAVQNHDVIIVAMTANAMEMHRRSCLEAGMNDYLTKPVKLKEIMKTIDKWLFPEKIAQEASKKSESKGEPSQSPRLYNKDAMLGRMDDNMALVKETVNLFLSNVPKLLENLKKATEAGDIMDMEIRAHTIKGNAVNVSADALKEIAVKIENASRKGDTQMVESLIIPLEQLISRVIHQLKEETFE